MIAFENRRVLVVGLGATGFATARVLLELGAKVRVTEASSSPDIESRAGSVRALGGEAETGGHDLDRLDADIAVISPGIAPSSAIVRALAAAGIRTVSEVEIAYRLARCDFLAVTGTNGKTTATSMLAAMLAESGIPTAAAGNIGWPLIEAIASVPEDGAIAVEVSSFQLAATEQFRPRVAVLLNIAEDHTDWHGSRGEYSRAKSMIVANQRADDIFIPNFEDPEVMKIASGAPSRVVPFSGIRVPERQPAAGVAEGHIVWRRTRIISVDDIPIPGAAGLEDATAAATAALEFGVDRPSVTRAIKSFRQLAHRLEVVAVGGGITYIDDSKATNPHATLSAIRGLSDVVLIAGGRSKGVDLAPLKQTVPPVIGIVALGEATAELEEVFSDLVPTRRADTMEEAVSAARSLSIPGGSVLLSPACASLDMYESYAARGEAFARAVGDALVEDSERG